MADQKANIFIAYSRKDKEFLEDLKSQLKILTRSPNNLVEKIWDDGDISAGDLWENAIHNAISSADIIILLISSDFLASDYCYEKEMMKALELHEQGLTKVIPIVVRDCAWHLTPFHKLQIPNDGKPIASDLKSKDSHYRIIVDELVIVLKKIIAFKLDYVENLNSKFQEALFYLFDNKYEKSAIIYREMLDEKNDRISYEWDEVQKRLSECDFELEFEKYSTTAETFLSSQPPNYKEALTMFEKAYELKKEKNIEKKMMFCEFELKKLEHEKLFKLLEAYINSGLDSFLHLSTSPKVQPKKSRVPYAQFQSPQGLKSRWNCAV